MDLPVAARVDQHAASRSRAMRAFSGRGCDAAEFGEVEGQRHREDQVVDQRVKPSLDPEMPAEGEREDEGVRGDVATRSGCRPAAPGPRPGSDRARARRRGSRRRRAPIAPAAARGCSRGRGRRGPPRGCGMRRVLQAVTGSSRTRVSYREVPSGGRGSGAGLCACGLAGPAAALRRPRRWTAAEALQPGQAPADHEDQGERDPADAEVGGEREPAGDALLLLALQQVSDRARRCESSASRTGRCADRDRRVGGHEDRQSGELAALVQAQRGLPAAVDVDRPGDPVDARARFAAECRCARGRPALPAGEVEPDAPLARRVGRAGRCRSRRGRPACLPEVQVEAWRSTSARRSPGSGRRARRRLPRRRRREHRPRDPLSALHPGGEAAADEAADQSGGDRRDQARDRRPRGRGTRARD